MTTFQVTRSSQKSASVASYQSSKIKPDIQIFKHFQIVFLDNKQIAKLPIKQFSNNHLLLGFPFPCDYLDILINFHMQQAQISRVEKISSKQFSI